MASSPTEFYIPPVAPLHAVHLSHLVLWFFLLVLCRICYKYIEQDYQDFLALGPGGTPYSFRGYAQLFFISLLRLRDPYLAPEISPRLQLKHGFLKNLKARQGPRPKLAGIAPQRQVSQNCSRAMIQALQATIRDLAVECPSHLHVDTSAFEMHSEALFSRYLTFNEPNYYGEVVHSHSSDGSMHLVLHPEDVKTVLERGWGERHPLSRGITWWWRAPVPRGFMIVYGPRDETELQQIKHIIRAAAWWVSGVDPMSPKTGSHEVQMAKRDGGPLAGRRTTDSIYDLSACLGTVVSSPCAGEMPLARSSRL